MKGDKEFYKLLSRKEKKNYRDKLKLAKAFSDCCECYNASDPTMEGVSFQDHMELCAETYGFKVDKNIKNKE